ncbi:hypothetical protein [Actinoplanes regularis]|uniref:Uncharacterized protein n=1 Tax=Actinoplanes regularis TaxID=52697 RepID=A0A239IYB7_9ACTN|nr:hypothetical protein [Actinoplanes regularis]GIE91608.1 hypothetical protein Are01nite_80880 [Actinoplanes regularis]SNS98003.1 hypothetical protein SAMN06264365_13148 [Actinoplanes regularis]
MILFYIAVYHNLGTRFLQYQPGHPLTKVISHWRHLPAKTSPEQIADWAYHVFNADLDQLQGLRGRTTNDGEIDFLLACTYQLLKLRSLSTGDVVTVFHPDAGATWLACEFAGWRRISEPATRTGHGLIPATIGQHLSRGQHA